MTLNQKVDNIQKDLTKIVNFCNEVEDYRRAQIAQQALAQVGQLSDQLAAEPTATGEIAFV